MKLAALVSITTAALAGCQLGASLRLPGRAGNGGGSTRTTGADPVAGDSGAAPATAAGRTTTVAVDSDLCGADPDGDPGAAEHRRKLRDRTTVCTMITVEPVEGVARIAPRRPGWCDQLPKSELARALLPQATSAMQDLVAERYWWATTRKVLGPLCASPDDAAVQQQTAYFYQWWVNRTALTPEQLDGLFRYFGTLASADLTLYPDTMAKVCKAFPPASNEASERDRLIAQATRASLGCAEHDGAPYWVSRGATDDLFWHLDALEAPPSELVRAHSVLHCLGEPDEIDDDDLAAYAVCGADGRGLDLAALEKEIAGYHELARAHARLTVAAARRITARYEAVARAKAAQDPAWQALLYDAPASGWAAWTKAYQANRAAIDAARAYEARYLGASRKAARGCWRDAWGALSAYVAKVRPDDLAAIKAAMTTGPGTILLEHVVACADAEGQTRIATVLGQLFSSARPARGPRYAAYFAVLEALNEIRADRSKFALDPSRFARFYRDRSPVAGSIAGSVTELDLAREDGGGVVKHVKRDGAGVRVEFKTDRWKAPIWNCTPTNRIQQFRPDGTVIYEKNCTYGGEQWVERTHDPIWVPAEVAAGLAPGTFVRSAGSIERHGDAWDSIPVEVWATKDRTKLVAYLGLAL